jgi:SAM-dependent methyltransferase
MNFTYVPEEIYVPTVVMGLEWEGKQYGNGNARYIHWRKEGDCHPTALTEYFFQELSATDAFFARKFEYPSCERLVEMTNQYLLRKEEYRASETGAWQHNTFTEHCFDEGLSNAIIHFCKVNEVAKVVDLGCGPGWYVTALRRNKIATLGYDGNPHTEELSRLLLGETNFPCEQADLTEELVPEEPYDLALCISVGEYIPEQYEEQVLQNLANATKRYLIISWASGMSPLVEAEAAGSTNTAPQPPDEKIVNPREPQYLVEKLHKAGFEEDKLASHLLRQWAWKPRNKETVLVFKKTVRV